MMNAPKLSIIIVNYNVKDLLLTCIRSVYSYTQTPFEIILVDNNSSDDSVEAVGQEFTGTIIIDNKYNAGFPKANNQGIEIAKGEYILLLNPDTELLDNGIDKLVDYLDKNKNESIVAPKLLNTDKSLQQSIQPFITVWEIIAETFFLHTWLKKEKGYFKNYKNETASVEALSGAAIMVRRSLIDRIGGLDEDLFWTEDMEFCYRAHLHNVNRIYYPAAEILHHIGQSGKKNLDVMLSNQVLTKVKYFKKNHTYSQFFIVKLFRFIHILTRLALFGLLSIFKKEYRSKFNAYIFTFNRFIRNDY